MAKKTKKIEEEIKEPYNEELGGEIGEGSGGVIDNPIYNELVKQIFSTQNIFLKSHFSAIEINLISRLLVKASVFDSKMLKDYLQQYAELKLSLKRLSRQELVNIFRTISSNNSNEQNGQKGNAFSRAIGFGREW